MSTGKTYSTKYLQDSKNNRGSEGQILSSTSSGVDWVTLSEISGVDGTGTANYLSKWLDANTITNSLVYDDGTNVGIGDTTPSYKLDVNGTFRVVDDATFNSDVILQNYQSGSVSTAMTAFKKGFTVTMPESNDMQGNPYFMSDLAYFNKKGGTVTATGLTGSYTWDTLFRADAEFVSITSSEYSGSTFTLELSDVSAVNSLTWGAYCGITFGASAWKPSSVAVEFSTDNGSTYTTALNSSASNHFYYTKLNNAGTTIKNIKFTIGLPSGSSLRIVNIFATDYNGQGMKNYFVPSDGGSYYGDVIWRDSKKATFGNSNDLQIYHDGSNSYIDDIGTGNLIIGAANFQLMNVAHTENHITATDNGSVDLYYDNSKKFETTSAGISITGNIILPDANPSNNTGTLKLGAGADLQIYHNGVNSFIDNGTGNLTIDAGVHLLLRNATGESLANFYANGSNELFYDNSKKFETTAAGVEVTGGINASGTLDISATYPRINLNDTNHEDDWSIINADGAFTIYNVDDNVNAIHISNVNNVTLGADLTVSGGDITLGGTGRIQGVDTVTNATDAANKAYVDAQVGSADTLQEVTDNGNTTTNSVGIGVTNPSEKLVVNVNAAGIKSALILNNEHGYGSGVGVAAAALQFGRDNSVAGGQTLISGQIYSGNENETTSNPCFMAFSTKSGVSPFSVTERMRINSSGNVGIGTTGPATELEVNGDIGIGRVAGGYTFRETVGGGLRASMKSNASNELIFSYGSNSEAMRINSSGNVGIGTTSPGTYKLNVAGGGRFSLNVDFANNHGIRGTKTDNSVIKILGLNSSNELVINENASTTVPTRIVGDYIALEPTNFLGAATEAVRIIEGGNVGIGTTSPKGKLHVLDGTAGSYTPDSEADTVVIESSVVGGISLIGTGSASVRKQKIVFGTIADPTGAEVRYDPNNSFMSVGTTAASNFLKLITGNGTEAMRLAADGNVGIGTTNPSEKLDVVGNVKLTGNLNVGGYIHPNDESGNLSIFGGNNTTNDAQILLHGNSNFWGSLEFNYGYDATNSFLKISQGSTEHLRITNGGKVGIGTTNPATKLHVGSGSGATVDTAYQIVADSSGIAGIQILASASQSSRVVFGDSADNNVGMIKYDHANNAMSFNTSATEKVRITSSGNVGIGTTSPGTYKLNVAGGGRFSLNVDFANNHGIRGTKTDNSVIKILGLNSSNELVINENASTTVPTRIVGDYITLEPTNFLGAATEAVRIIEGGNVGIGITGPSAKLEVNAGVANNVTGPAARISKGASPIGLIRYDTLVVEANDVATIRIGESDGTVSTIMSGDSNLRINSTHSIKFSTAGTTTGEAFSGQGGTLALTLDNSQNATFAGDVTVSGGGITLGGTGRIQGVDTVTNATDAANKAYVDAQVGSADTLQEVTDNGNTTTNSVGIGTTNPKSKLDVNGVFCVDSKAHTVTDAFTTCLTVNLDSHAGCHVVITLFGDWSGHSSAAYRGEFFLQNGANGYGEPGIILRQDDNTFTGTDQIICQIVDPTSTANPKDFQIQIRHTDTTSPASWTGQLTYTVQGKFNSIT